MNDRLYRSRTDRMIGGVAGGLADRLGLDPSLVRVTWVVLAVLSGGVFLLIYLVMLVVVPEAPFDWPARSDSGHDPWSSPAATGIRPTPAPASGTVGAPADETARLSLTGGPAGEPADGDPGPGRTALHPTPPPAPPWRPPKESGGDRNGALVFGLILILIGGLFLIGQYAPEIDLGAVWPAVAVVVGVLLVGLAFVPGRGRD